jgi:hypothetical protein
MSEAAQQELGSGPEELILSRLITESNAASNYFGGSSYGEGFSDIAEGVYTAGSIRHDPFNLATITFMAERFRDEPGAPVNTTDYTISLSVARTIQIVDVPIEVCETLMELQGGEPEEYHEPLTRFQHIVTIDFRYDDCGYFTANYKTHYRANEDEDLCVSIEDEGLAMPVFGFGSIWEFDPEEAEYNGSVGTIALQGTFELSEGETFGDTDHFNLIFEDMTDGVKVDMENIQLARMLIKCMRRRHIPQSLREALGFTDVYNPRPGRS